MDANIQISLYSYKQGFPCRNRLIFAAMQNQPTVQSEPEISVFEIWQIIRDGWFLVVVSTAVFTGLALAVAAVMPTSYSAEVVIMDASQQGTPQAVAGGLLGQLAGLGGFERSGRSGGPSAATLLRSRTFAEHFIERHNLLPELFHKQWDDERNAWVAGSTPPTLDVGAHRFLRIFNMGQARDVPGASTLTVRWRDPVLAAEWANGLITQVNEVARARDIAEAERSIAYLNDQMARTNVVELQRVLFGLLEQEQKTLMLANAREAYAYEVIDPALVPQSPAAPNRPQVIAAGVVAGIFFGLFAVFLRAVVRSWRRSQGVMEKRPTP